MKYGCAEYRLLDAFVRGIFFLKKRLMEKNLMLKCCREGKSAPVSTNWTLLMFEHNYSISAE